MSDRRLASRDWRRANPEKCAEYKRTANAKLLPIVYAWFAPDGKADWVGRGTVKRANHHRYTSSWWTPRHLLVSMTCDSEWQAMEFEGAWGGRLLPRYNREGYRH